MSKPKDNPHLDLGNIMNTLPPDSPAREVRALTLLQRMALPVMLWFFDPQRERGTGRSWLMAHVVLQLALRGYKVPIEDLSAWLAGAPTRDNRHFISIVNRVAEECYPNAMFSVDRDRDKPLSLYGQVVRYVGWRPE